MEKSVKAKIGLGVFGVIAFAGYIYAMWFEPFSMLIKDGMLPFYAFLCVIVVNVITIVIIVLFILAMVWCFENFEK